MVQIVPLPAPFLERMSRLLGDEYPAFVQALDRAAVHGLRVNTLKVSVQEFRGISPFPLGRSLPWCASAFILENEAGAGKHPFHRAGLYYLQDPSAMSAPFLLDPKPGERVLDLAASPGGKTTQLISLMEGRGLLVSNEIKTKRLNHLVANVQRWGAGNVVVTNENPERLADHFGPAFDRVLVDAPCSGEGMFRRDNGARLDWSEQMVAVCTIRQTNILRVAAHLVRPGGHLLYSTCTFAPEEDEGVIAQFLREHPDYEVENLPLLPGFMGGRPEWLEDLAGQPRPEASLRGAVRLFPDRVDGDGHFVCRLQRKDVQADDRIEAWEPRRLPAGLLQTWRVFIQECLNVDYPPERLRLQGDRLYFVPENVPRMEGLNVTLPGICLGNFKKERFEPAHTLALALGRGQAQNILDLGSESRDLAAYLRGESLPSHGIPGWTLITVDGWPLGWGKRVQGIVKNHYPRGWQAPS